MASQFSPESWIERAERALASAALVLKDGDANDACSNAYYAMFYAARAALIHVDQPERALGKTHSGMIAAFHQFLVLPGLIETQHGQAFSRQFSRRVAADYDLGGVSAADATETIANAEAFVAAIKELIEATGPGDDPKHST